MIREVAVRNCFPSQCHYNVAHLRSDRLAMVSRQQYGETRIDVASFCNVQVGYVPPWDSCTPLPQDIFERAHPDWTVISKTTVGFLVLRAGLEPAVYKVAACL
jgi:hypothetical protein